LNSGFHIDVFFHNQLFIDGYNERFAHGFELVFAPVFVMVKFADETGVRGSICGSDITAGSGASDDVRLPWSNPD